MAYRISNQENDTLVVSYHDVENQSVLWKKEKVKDEIIIKAMGRNMYSRIFNDHITYRIYDYLIPKNKRIRPLEVTIIFDKNGLSTGISIISLEKYLTPREAQYICDAVIAVDKEFTKIGGGVSCKHPFHKHLTVVHELLERLTETTEKIV